MECNFWWMHLKPVRILKNEVVELIMGHGDGVNLMYKYGTKNNVNIISYASDVQETGFINSKEELQKYSSIETMLGEANEAVGT